MVVVAMAIMYIEEIYAIDLNKFIEEFIYCSI